MKYLIFLLSLLLSSTLYGQTKTKNSHKDLISPKDYAFLESLTKAVLDSSRIFPGEQVTEASGKNNTGGTLIRPGGRNTYPAFWIRDYAMALDCGFVTEEEQEHMLLLTAATQCDQAWITDLGSLIPFGAVADHIRIDDSKPIYFPGAMEYHLQGNKTFGMTPPYSDQYFFIHMAYYFVKTFAKISILSQNINGTKLIDRLEIAFKMVPSKEVTHINYTTDDFRGVDFGFRDVITITGDLCLPSIFKYRAAMELSELFEMLGDAEKSGRYYSVAGSLKESIPALFASEKGIFKASTGKSSQPDIWSTALAVEYGILTGDDLQKACGILTELYKNGDIAYKGNIRHVAKSDDFDENTSWEFSLVKKNVYQNGAYWGTPVGWVGAAIARVDTTLAKKLIGEYIAELRESDFRQGVAYGGPYECFYSDGYKQNPIYLTSVACPFIVLKHDN